MRSNSYRPGDDYEDRPSNRQYDRSGYRQREYDDHDYDRRNDRRGRGDYSYDRTRSRSRSRSPYRGDRQRAYQSDRTYRREQYPVQSHRRRAAVPDGFYSDVSLQYDDEADPEYHGDQDVAPDDSPMNWVLIRGLKKTVTEELLSKALDRVCSSEEDTSGADPASIKRICLIRSRRTDTSMGFALVEFHSNKEARAAVTKAKALGPNCTVSSQQMNFDFPHTGIFKPSVLFRGNQKRWEISWHDNQKFVYYKIDYYASEYVMNEHPPQVAADDLSSSADASKNISSEPPAKKRKKAEASELPQLAKWAESQAELRAPSAPKPGHPASGVNAVEVAAIPDEQTFMIDTSKLKCCYLCNAKFNNSNILQRHLAESAKHRQLMQDAGAVATGLQRMAKNNVSPEDTIKYLGAQRRVASTAETQYRDRAAERRQEETGSGGEGRKLGFALTKKKVVVKEEKEVEEVAPFAKGAAMLYKNGGGPEKGEEGVSGGLVPQNMYAAGVGLGHEASNQGDAVEAASRSTRGESDYLDKAKEAASRRYQSMQ